MPAQDYYATLGVKRGASDKEVRQAFRRLARKHHPDVNPGDKAAEARFKEINAAYEVLSDSEKRRKYDLYGDQWQYADQMEEMRRRGGGARSFRGGPSGGRVFEFDAGDLRDLGGDLGGVFDSLFRGFGGAAGRRRRPAGRGQDLEQPIEVTLAEVLEGGTRTIQVSYQEACATCGGQGRIAAAICHVCQGSGAVARPKRLEVKVPAGVRDGARIRIAGEGGPGVDGRRGDLYLRVSVRSDPRFERRGDDLYTEVALPLTVAVLGGEVEATTVKGRVMLKVPPLTQNGRVFRLAGLGLPRPSGAGRGDLFARASVKLPDKLSEREKKLFEELRAVRKE